LISGFLFFLLESKHFHYGLCMDESGQLLGVGSVELFLSRCRVDIGGAASAILGQM
jgi:hypothetical protein